MTLTEFAALWGLTVKYCDLTLTTGANDGSDWANAFKTGPDAETGSAPGVCVAFKSRSIAQTTPTWVTSGVAGTAAAPIVWVAVDDSDNVVDSANWKGYGGAVGVTVDMTGSTGDIRGINIATSAHINRYFFGFEIIGANHCFLSAAQRALFFYCKSKNARSTGFITNLAGCGYYKCTFDGDLTGLSSTTIVSARSLVFKNCVTGVNASFGPFLSCIFAGNTTAINSGPTFGLTLRNCGFYNNATHIDLGTRASARLTMSDTLIVGGTTGVNANATTQNVDMFNTKWYDVTNIMAGAGAANVMYMGDSGELSEAPMVDPASGNYMSKSTIAALKNVAERINEDTYQYSQAGLIQQVVAGGGYRPRARTIGI